MSQNIDPETGLRYGAIATNSLDPDLVVTLFYGRQATNVSEEEAYAEAEAEASAEYEALIEQADTSAAESGANLVPGFDLFLFQEKWFEKHGYQYDKEDFVDRGLEDWTRHLQIEEPTITGTHGGVTYQIGWLGGAAILWVFHGPTGNASSLCSPCVPNAANLSSFVLDSEPEFTPGKGFPCYCVPRDWLDEERT